MVNPDRGKCGASDLSCATIDGRDGGEFFIFCAGFISKKRERFTCVKPRDKKSGGGITGLVNARVQEVQSNRARSGWT